MLTVPSVLVFSVLIGLYSVGDVDCLREIARRSLKQASTEAWRLGVKFLGSTVPDPA